MKRGTIWGLAAALGTMAFAGVAGAEEAVAAPPAAAGDGHANGLMLQGRLQANSGLLSLGGGPSFMLGYQASSFALGLGLGLNRVSVSARDDLDGAVTLFQVMPIALVDVWRSADGRARANLIGGIGYGRLSFDSTASVQRCVPDALGNDVCTTTSEEASAGAGFVPFMLGFGGDYYFSRNFALGAEVGVQAAFTTGIDSESGGTSRSVDASGNLQVAYGALRATFVLGD